jgi:hypothetical protein
LNFVERELLFHLMIYAWIQLVKKIEVVAKRRLQELGFRELVWLLEPKR